MQTNAYLLTRERIRAIVSATTRNELLNILADCGYNTELPNDDAIIDAEKAKTLKTFAELSTDGNVTDCVTLLSTITETTVVKIFKDISRIIPKIKNVAVREYFITLADLTNVRTFYKKGNTFVLGGRMGTRGLDIFPNMDLTQIEDAIHARLDKLAAADKDNLFKPNLLFWWYMEKQKEFIAVKTILMNKAFGFHAGLIRENLRGLYERFK